MSEQQKVFASLSGAVAVHVLLLMFVFGWMGTRSIGSSLRPDDAEFEEEPTEVTILLKDLIELTEVEPPEPERPSRAFMDTSSNTPLAEAPENARFESDRNTRAATELLPSDPSSQRDVPTTEGSSPLSHLVLRKEKFVDGEFDRPRAASPDPLQPREAQTAVTPPATEVSQASPGNPRSGLEGEGEGENVTDGVDTPPETEVAESRMRPEATLTEGSAEEQAREKTFLLPDSETGHRVAPGEEQADQIAKARSEEEAEIGEAADAPRREEQREGSDLPETDSVEEAPVANQQPDMRALADQGLFADGFSAEKIQNTASGRLTNIGQNAVDAEETESGKYKAAVRQAISRKWHRYRVQNADFVTWGVLKIECRVDRFGKVHDLRIVKNEANSVLANFSLKAILDADIPPMPPDVAEELGPNGLELKYDIIIY